MSRPMSVHEHARRSRRLPPRPRMGLPESMLGAALLLFVADAGLAQPYVSVELGANIGPRLDTIGSSNDPLGATCDEFINPQFAVVARTVGYESVNCVNPPLGDVYSWTNSFGSGNGVLAGAAAGYAFGGRFRLEVDYFYRDTAYDETSPLTETGAGQPLQAGDEFTRADERIGSVVSHNLFGNVYFDFVNDSPLTPYVGFGVGVGWTDVDYAEWWIRTRDVTLLTNGAPRGGGPPLPNADEIRRNLLGVVTTADTALGNTLRAYQVPFGVDYAVSEAFSLGLRVRWVTYDSFEEYIPLDLLRSHVPNLRIDGSQPVSDHFETDDIRMISFGLNARYRF